MLDLFSSLAGALVIVRGGGVHTGRRRPGDGETGDTGAVKHGELATVAADGSR